MPPRPRTPRQPQDRQPKAVKALAGSVFEFEHDGQTYQLPPAGPYAQKSDFTTGDLIDASINGDKGAEMRMTISIVEAAKDDIGDAYDALRATPAIKGMQIIQDWLQASGTEPGK